MRVKLPLFFDSSNLEHTPAINYSLAICNLMNKTVTLRPCAQSSDLLFR